jgi:hypothetical protein
MLDQKNWHLYLQNEKGFSLIEVIVASIILFAAISISAGLFKTSAGTLNKVYMTVAVSDLLPDIMEHVREELMDGNTKGRGEFGDNCSYEYQIKKIEDTKNLISEYHPFKKGFLYGSFNISLLAVNLDIYYIKEGTGKKISYDYKELIWSSTSR